MKKLLKLLQLLFQIYRLAPKEILNLLSQLRIGLAKNSSDEMRYRSAEVLATTVYPHYKFSSAKVMMLNNDLQRLVPQKKIENLLTQLCAVLTERSSDQIQYRAAERSVPRDIDDLLAQLFVGLSDQSEEDARYRAAEALTMAIYPTYKFSEYGRLYLDDQPFLDYYRRFMDANNWHSLDRKYTLDQLLKLTSHLSGDIAECGVYKGFSAYRMCMASRSSSKLVHLFDSFEGLSAPGRLDGNYWSEGRFSVREDALRETLVEFKNYRVYRGWIPNRYNEVKELTFSFVHIDVDLHQPTLDSLEFFYPRVESNGVILMDDYGVRSCPGAKLAADSFFADKKEPIILLTTGQGLVIKR